MGTRADFYVGRGEKAEWLGSVAWDGYPDGMPDPVLDQKEEAAFRSTIADFLTSRDDATTPDKGWPWPWNDSRTTDYAYAFDEGKTWVCSFGGKWYEARDPKVNEDEDRAKVAVFPNMASRKNVARGSSRSGTIVISRGPDGSAEIE